MMNNVLLLLGAVSSISFGSLGFQKTNKTFDVYSEDCIQRYELIVERNRSVLFDKETDRVVESFNGDKNPYLNSGFNCDYLIYGTTYEEYKYLGVVDEKLINLETGLEAVIEKETNTAPIHDALIGVSYGSIPLNAKFCKYSYYFGNLDEHGFGKNTTKTCTIVAMQILFGYYDSIWSDLVVEERFDEPVSEHKIHCADFSKSAATKAEEFHSYLINYCDSYIGTDVKAKGLSNINQNKLINSYVGTARNLEYGNNTSEGNFSDILSGKQFGVVKDAINAGRPAILNTLQHSMVAFAYDDTYVYLMSGWRGDKQISKMNWDKFNGNVFSNACAAYDLQLKCAHTCSDNYYSTVYGRYICPRDF